MTTIHLGQQPLTIQSIQRGYLITMFCIWAIGIQLPRLLIRYGKSYSQVIDIHSISMTIIGLLTILYVIGYVVGYYTLRTDKNKTTLQFTQMSLALALAFLVLIQFILGYVTRAQMAKPTLSTNLFTIKQSHKIIGNLMSILGKAIVTLQLYIYNNELLKSWLFLLGGLTLLYIIIEVIYRSQTKTIILEYPHKEKNKHQKYHKEIYDCLLKGVQQFQNFKHLGVRYLIVDNCMYYIDENFLHPGGEYIFDMYNGKEINYLLKGTRQLTPEYPRHIHTKYVMKYLQHRIIGDLPTQSILINQKVTNEYIDWKIKKVKQQGVDGRLVTMENQAGYVRQLLKVENFGKYIMMSCPNQEILAKIQRPYTLILSLCQAQKRITDKFKQAYNFYYTGKCENTSLLEKTQLTQVLSSNLTFMIKQYKDGLFTKFLFNSTMGKKYTITGPYGKGLGLKSTTRGYYIFIGVGSGITPYIDLFSYLLQKTLIELIAHKAGESKARRVNSENINFSPLTDLKILFIGSFTSSSHFYFRDLLKDLYELNRIHKLSNFNMLLKYQNNQIQSDVMMIKDSFDRAFFKSLLQEQNPDKIYYCGPSSIQLTMRKLESQDGIKDKFVYV